MFIPQTRLLSRQRHSFRLKEEAKARVLHEPRLPVRFTDCKRWVPAWRGCPCTGRSGAGGGLAAFSGLRRRRKWLRLEPEYFLDRGTSGWRWGHCWSDSAVDKHNHICKSLIPDSASVALFVIPKKAFCERHSSSDFVKHSWGWNRCNYNSLICRCIFRSLLWGRLGACVLSWLSSSPQSPGCSA